METEGEVRMPGRTTALRTHGDLRIERRALNRCHTVRLSGELDIASVAQLEAAIAPLPTQAREVIFDLEALSFIDLSGLRCILACQAACGRANTAFLLVPGKGQARRLLDVTGALDDPQRWFVSSSVPRSSSVA
jgi:anti-anti-sigma factor